MVQLDCFYSLSSPWAYFAGPKLQDIVRRHRAKLVLKPYDFQVVAPRNGGKLLRTRVPPHRRYHQEELARWSEWLGMPMNIEPRHYPQGAHPDADWNKHAGWMVIAAQAQGLDAFVLSHALLRALWAEERDTARAEVRIAVANENGYDGKVLQALEDAPETRALYAQYSDEAERIGVFGAPTFVLDGVRYWGQDRLDFVDRALAAKSAMEAA